MSLILQSFVFDPSLECLFHISTCTILTTTLLMQDVSLSLHHRHSFLFPFEHKPIKCRMQHGTSIAAVFCTMLPKSGSVVRALLRLHNSIHRGFHLNLSVCHNVYLFLVQFAPKAQPSLRSLERFFLLPVRPHFLAHLPEKDKKQIRNEQMRCTTSWKKLINVTFTFIITFKALQYNCSRFLKLM